MSLHVLVLAGGSGTRLWPLSRASAPKHLLPLAAGGRTLLRATVERVLPLGGAVHVVTAASQVPACEAALAGLDLRGGGIIAEPEPRGTGPALGLAVRTIARGDPEALICSVHADHHVGDDLAYRGALLAAAGWALATGGLATIGLAPAFAATGFGYVALGSRRPRSEWRPAVDVPDAGESELAAELPCFEATGFVEKPDAARAADFVAGGRHLWNSGLFAWTAGAFLAELHAADAVLDEALGGIVERRAAGDEARAGAAYARLPTVAVDPLVLERTSSLSVVRAAFPWSDLGSWSDLAAIRVAAGDCDADGNVAEGEVISAGCRDSLVWSAGGRLVAVVGLNDTVVVDTGDAVLVVPAARAQSVREIVEMLRAAGRTDLL